MTRSYALACLALVAAGIAVLWPLLEPPGRRGLATAGVVAYGVQVAAFWLLARSRSGVRSFVRAWAGGMALRLLAVGAVALLVVRGKGLPPVPTLVGLVGFFFALLVAEFFFLRPVGSGEAEIGGKLERPAGRERDD